MTRHTSGSRLYKLNVIIAAIRVVIMADTESFVDVLVVGAGVICAHGLRPQVTPMARTIVMKV